MGVLEIIKNTAREETELIGAECPLLCTLHLHMNVISSNAPLKETPE